MPHSKASQSSFNYNFKLAFEIVPLSEDFKWARPNINFPAFSFFLILLQQKRCAEKEAVPEIVLIIHVKQGMQESWNRYLSAVLKGWIVTEKKELQMVCAFVILRHFNYFETRRSICKY